MSDVKKQINKLVSTKIKNRDERLKDAAGNTEETGNVLTDYKLYFDGMKDALKAAQVGEDDSKSVYLAAQTNEMELTLLEQRMTLDQALGGEEDEEE